MVTPAWRVLPGVAVSVLTISTATGVKIPIFLFVRSFHCLTNVVFLGKYIYTSCTLILKMFEGIGRLIFRIRHFQRKYVSALIQ